MAQDIAPPIRPAGPRPADLTPLARAWLVALARARAWAAGHAEQLTCAGVLLLTLAHLGRVYNRGFNLLDEGFVLHVAERVLQGQVPYRDFFTQLTPGAFLALAAVFAVTGPSVIVGRWVTVVLGVLITALLYTSGRRILSRPAAALAALAFPIWGIGQGWFYPNYSWFALAGCMLALQCLLHAVAPRPGQDGDARASVAWSAGAGFACGIATFCKQNMGVYALVGVVVTLLVAGPFPVRGRLWRSCVACLAALPIPLGLLVWLAYHGALADFFRDAVWIPLVVFPREMAAPYPAFWPPWPQPQDTPGRGDWAFRLVCLLPPLPYGLGLAKLILSRLRRRPVADASRHAAEVAWLTAALALWGTAFPRADFDHVQVALGPAFVLGATVLESVGRLAVRHRVWRLWGAPHREILGRIDDAWCRRWLPQTLAGGVVAAFLVVGLGHARALHMGPGWTLRTLSGVAPRAAGILLDHDDAAELRHLVQEVRRLSAPGEAIVSLPWNAGLYFLAERRNASRYDLFIPASILPEDIPEIERALEEARLIVYWTARDSFINNTSLDDRSPELHNILVSRYRAVAAINAYRLLLRDE
ncbi:MAG: glycosyltransferase family 39 protein, partial [Chloroflexota bacterium]|nr:glycosyltransferase family 39 protein [Chloroflexota bacterium]